jgi:hypothetical protein
MAIWTNILHWFRKKSEPINSSDSSDFGTKPETATGLVKNSKRSGVVIQENQKKSNPPKGGSGVPPKPRAGKSTRSKK